MDEKLGKEAIFRKSQTADVKYLLKIYNNTKNGWSSKQLCCVILKFLMRVLELHREEDRLWTYDWNFTIHDLVGRWDQNSPLEQIWTTVTELPL